MNTVNLIVGRLLVAAMSTIVVTSDAIVLSNDMQSHDRPVIAEKFHHQIHNFFFNDGDKEKSNYLSMQKHAVAMSYDTTTHYLANKLPGELDEINRMMLHDAYFMPLKVTFSDQPEFVKHQVKYTVSYRNKDNFSQVNTDRLVWNAYPIEDKDIEIIKGYACALHKDYQFFNTRSSFNNAQKWFHIDKDYKTITTNWQSKFVVDTLATATLKSLQTGKYDYLFFDDLLRDVTGHHLLGDCVNKAYGGEGYYDSWKDGQLAFLQKVTTGARNIKGYHGKPFKVFANIWSPYADIQTAKWYANNQLRLDHYYFESGGHAREDAYNGQSANSTDPETGLPAFKPLLGGGYIPANLVSLGTHIATMEKLVKPNVKTKLFNDYLQQHYKAAGIALKQGSWFGWYGETSVDKLDAKGKLIHTNEMQLLRAIPNWDNLAKLPLNVRQYNESKQSYSSPNSRFNNLIIQSRNPINGEFYAIFKSNQAQLDLLGTTIVAAYFVDDNFSKTLEDAMACLKVDASKARLICDKKINRGIRIITH